MLVRLAWLTSAVWPHPDSAGAAVPEVLVSLREHLEAGRVIPAEGAVHRAARGPAARLLRQVHHHVAWAGQCLPGLSLHQKVF